MIRSLKQKMKPTFSFLILSIIVLTCSSFFPQSSTFSDVKEIEIGKTLCSSSPNVGTCRGSAYCTACKNCKYCRYCNNGGSCGVCSKRSTRTYSTPKYKKQKKNSSPKRRIPRKTYTPPKNPIQYSQPTYLYNSIYTITKKTSLREFGTSKSKVLKRLNVKTEVIILDNSGKFWWKVRSNGKTGWVKKHLLKKKDPTA